MSSYFTQFEIPSDNLIKNSIEYEDDFRAKLSFFEENEYYPIGLFSDGLHLEFSPLTILYGNNGSGKSTILNLIAEKMNIGRRTQINNSPFFSFFAQHCTLAIHSDFDDIDKKCDIITSDDVFRHCFEVRNINNDIGKKQNSLINSAFQKRTEMAFGIYKISPLRGMDDFDRWSQDYDDKKRLKKSSSAYIKKYASHFLKPNSNGETALEFFLSKIDGAGVYLLDEPENSLSPSFQLKLMEFIELSLHLGIQFIIATHSPLLLGLQNAKILNLDIDGAPEYKWDELENIKILKHFFNQQEQ
ncbi:MAG: AAA family ATPase [Lentisphaeria bacterium]|nr:AAA family ATPase [Lentisphaeria bacterium]